MSWLSATCQHGLTRSPKLQVDTEVFDVLVEQTGRTKAELHEWAKSENELNEICTAEEIAGPILFLASDASSFISGVHIPIAGAAQASHGHISVM